MGWAAFGLGNDMPHDCESLFFCKGLISLAGGALWFQRVFVWLGTPRNGLCCLWILQRYPSRLWISLFFKRHFYSCRRCPLGLGCIWKTWEPNKWVVLPTGFAMIPHTIVNMSFYFFKRDYFSCWRCPYGSQGICKTWESKKWVKQLMGFAMIPHVNVNRTFSKRCFYSCWGCPLDSRTVNNYVLGPQEMDYVVYFFFAMIPHVTVSSPFSKGLISRAGDSLWVVRTSLWLGTQRNGLCSIKALPWYPT